MFKTYYNEYELLVDLPTGEKKGDHFFFHVSNDDCNRIWYQVGELHEILTKKWYQSWSTTGVKLKIEQMTPNFFKPIGEPRNLYPTFPTIDKIEEFIYLVGETKLVNSVDEIRAIKPIFYSEEYKNACYELLKSMYNKKYHSTRYTKDYTDWRDKYFDYLPFTFKYKVKSSKNKDKVYYTKEELHKFYTKSMAGESPFIDN